MIRYSWLLCAGALCFGASTRLWEQASQADFEKGTLKKVTLRSDGRLRLAPLFKEVYDASANYLWAVAEDSKGSVYIGGSGQDSKCKLTRIDAAGHASVAAELPGLEIHALAIDAQDRVYAATSPDGKVYRIDAAGRSSVFYEPKTKYIWALAIDAKGNLFVATGDKGEVHRVTPDGQGAVFLKTEEAHARSLAVDPAGTLYAGTEPGGLIFRVSPRGQAFVLYQSSKREITALAVSPSGALYAAAVGNKGTMPMSPVMALPPPLPAAPTVAGTVRPASPQPGPAPLPSLGASLQGGSEVARIEADGYARRLWTHTSEIVYALTFDKQGRALIGTGNRGNLYRLDNDLLSSLLVNAAPTQITGLATSRTGKVFAVTGNIGKLFELGPGLETTGTFESEPLDAGFFTYWGRLSSNLRGIGVKVETRSGNLETPQRNWSGWSPVTLAGGAGRVTSPAARFLQYRVTFTATADGSSPDLSSVSVAYMPKNVAPAIELIDFTPPNYRFAAPSAVTPPSQSPQNLTLPALSRTAVRSSSSNPPSADQPSSSVSYAKGYVGVRWLARDENGDPLISQLEIRGVRENVWRPLKRDIRERNYSWDSTAFADGEYLLRLTVSDAPGNPPGAALSGSLVSDPFVIDNTPPRIVNLTATRKQVRWRASDALNALDKCEYSLDGGDWKAIEPTTRLTDSPEHDYVLTLEALSAGEHTLAVRVWDDYENQAVEKTVIR